jgi:ClpA/ClpB-like protein
LGLLREEKTLIRRLLPNLEYDAVHKEVAVHTKFENESGKQTPARLDLPLSNESKRALAYSAQEADRLNHRHIGTQHLLLALLREKKFPSAKLLSQHGAELKSLRRRMEALLDRAVSGGSVRAPIHRPAAVLPDTVEIHGRKWDMEPLRDLVMWCKTHEWHWEEKAWNLRDIVIKKSGKVLSFDLNLAENAAEFELVKGGWKKDHCTICRWELFESDDASHGIGFTNGKDWLCAECYKKFIAGDFFSSTYSDIT